jgi:hypothetical protein
MRMKMRPSRKDDDVAGTMFAKRRMVEAKGLVTGPGTHGNMNGHSSGCTPPGRCLSQPQPRGAEAPAACVKTKVSSARPRTR